MVSKKGALIRGGATYREYGKCLSLTLTSNSIKKIDETPTSDDAKLKQHQRMMIRALAQEMPSFQSTSMKRLMSQYLASNVSTVLRARALLPYP